MCIRDRLINVHITHLIDHLLIIILDKSGGMLSTDKRSFELRRQTSIWSLTLLKSPSDGASIFINWVNPFPSRFINRAIFFRSAIESYECASCLLSFLEFYCRRLFPPSTHETSSGRFPTREKGWLQGLVWWMEAPFDGPMQFSIVFFFILEAGTCLPRWNLVVSISLL